MQINRFSQTGYIAKFMNTDTFSVQETEKHWLENTLLIALNHHYSSLELPYEKAATEIIIVECLLDGILTAFKTIGLAHEIR